MVVRADFEPSFVIFYIRAFNKSVLLNRQYICTRLCVRLFFFMFQNIPFVFLLALLSNNFGALAVMVLVSI